MALAPGYIVDTSAQARVRHPTVRAALDPLFEASVVATCSALEIEFLFSSQSYADLVATRARRRGFTLVPTMQADFDRAIDVMELLARRGYHRAVQLPDLLVAAIAERAGLIILHYDAHYDLVADVTGQAARWVVPQGSVP